MHAALRVVLQWGHLQGQGHSFPGDGSTWLPEGWGGALQHAQTSQTPTRMVVIPWIVHFNQGHDEYLQPLNQGRRL